MSVRRTCASSFAGAALLAVANASQAITFSGSFADPANAALVGSDLGAPSFATVYDQANNVALYTFVVPTATTLTIRSTGYGAGGADPYVSLFVGAGNASTFVASSYYAPAGDFTLTPSVSGGTYRLAIGVFDNLSFAENYGSGTLADGFIGLGEPDSLRNGRYAVDVTFGAVTTPVPEPSVALLIVAGLAAVGWRGPRARQSSR